MTNPCKEIPNPIIDEEKQWLFAEIGRLHLSLTKANKEIERLKGLVPPDDTSFLGKAWSLIAEKLRLERDALSEILAGLREKGIIDQHNRPLPLEGHHKTCEHGNAECQKCGVGQPVPTIKTPEGKPLLPAAEFAAMQIEENKEVGLTECAYQRKSGRTTAMVLKALEFVKQNNSALVTINVYNFTMKKRIKELLKHYADELGVQHGQLSRVRVLDPGVYYPIAALNLRDNVFDDMKETKPARDPRQDLKVGEHVRFEIEGIIKERQSAGIFQDEDGSDFEPIQYAVKDSINGMNYYVGYHQITKVIGKEE